MHKDEESLCFLINRRLAEYGARRLSVSDLISQGRGFIFGWAINTGLIFNGTEIVINLLYEKKYACLRPVVRVAKPLMAPGDLPHVEANGKLCIWPERYIIDWKDLSYIDQLLDDAYKLLREGIAGDLNDHFIDEFQSYWLHRCHLRKSAVSLCSLENKNSRRIYCFPLKKWEVVFADTRETLIAWLDNQGILPAQSSERLRRKLISRCFPSALVYLNKGLIPAEYPKRAGELFSLIKRDFQENEEYEHILKLIADSLANDLSRPAVLIGFDTPNGSAVASLLFERNVFSRNWNGFGTKSVTDGFRNRMPLEVIISRLRSMSVFCLRVVRADASWIIGRESNKDLSKIAKHQVGIVGCGSVGAYVARLLLQSGIESLILCDSDVFRSENISRHLLGFDKVDIDKSSAVADRLSKEFPHARIESFSTEWQSDSAKKALNSADVIISCTADWDSDQAILSMQSESITGPIVFAFVEAHAMAGHVIVNPVGSEAFNSLHVEHGSRIGTLRAPVTYWPDNTLRRIPACAGEFQPYGVIPLTHLQALTAKAVLDLIISSQDDEIQPAHYVWIGNKSEMAVLGGSWSTEWISLHGDPGEGGRIMKLIPKDGAWKRCNA